MLVFILRPLHKEQAAIFKTRTYILLVLYSNVKNKNLPYCIVTSGTGTIFNAKQYPIYPRIVLHVYIVIKQRKLDNTS